MVLTQICISISNIYVRHQKYSIYYCIDYVSTYGTVYLYCTVKSLVFLFSTVVLLVCNLCCILLHWHSSEYL